MGLFDKLFKAKPRGTPVQSLNKPRGTPAVEITSCIIDGWDSGWGIADHALNLLADRRLVMNFNGQRRTIPPTVDISWLITWPEGCACCDSPASHNRALLIPTLKDPTQNPKLHPPQSSWFDCRGGWKVHVCSSCYRELSKDYSDAAKADTFVRLLRVNAPQLQFGFKSEIYAAKFKSANSSIYNPPSYWRPPRYVCSGCSAPVDDSGSHCTSCGLQQPTRASEQGGTGT
jgi:hypothetical protein